MNKSPSFSSLKFWGSRTLSNLEATENLAKEILSQLKPRSVIGLQGDLGSGKTHFVKALARQLGCAEDEVNSPSYAIHQEYQGANISLQHIDLYRLETDEEIESSGFWDLFYEENSFIAIEWVDRLQTSSIPQNHSYWRMEWECFEDGSRLVKIFVRENN